MSGVDWENKTVVPWVNTPLYKWSQTVDDVKVRILLGKNARPKHVEYALSPTHLKVGLRGRPPVIDGKLSHNVIPSDSIWTIEETEDGKALELVLAKCIKHESWQSVTQDGPKVDPMAKDAMDRKMMLEKFQKEHPGFDFSGAEFSGNLPEDPKAWSDWKYKMDPNQPPPQQQQQQKEEEQEKQEAAEQQRKQRVEIME